MKKIVLGVLLISMVIVIALMGCAKPSPAPTPTPAAAPPKTLDIGVATPLTGSGAFMGDQVRKSVLLAIDDQNEQGGITIAGQKYMLNAIVRDSKNDVLVSKSVAEELVYDKGIKVIVGPFLADAVGVQLITEPNKVIGIFLTSAMPGVIGPNKPYTLIVCSPSETQYLKVTAYINEFYPEAKTIISMGPDMPDLPNYLAGLEHILPRFTFKWLGVEKFPMTTKDFMPHITRVLPKKPDIIDTSISGGVMGALNALLVKQLREAGFNDIIMITATGPHGVIEEVVPNEYLTKIVTNAINQDGPIVSKAFRDLYYRAKERYNEVPDTMLLQVYNIVKPFFEFLNSQDTIDTIAWMKGFEKYHWEGIYGFETYWLGKKMCGIDRYTFSDSWPSEYKDGELVTEWQGPWPYDLFVE